MPGLNYDFAEYTGADNKITAAKQRLKRQSSISSSSFARVENAPPWMWTMITRTSQKASDKDIPPLVTIWKWSWTEQLRYITNASADHFRQIGTQPAFEQGEAISLPDSAVRLPGGKRG